MTRTYLLSTALLAATSALFAQTPPDFIPDDPGDLDPPTDSPPDIDPGDAPDLDIGDIPNIGDKLQAVSTRSPVSTGAGVMISGFLIEGSGSKTVVIRGLGPSFQSDDIPDVIDDPVIKLLQLNEDTRDFDEIATNDNWETGLSSAGRTFLEDNDFLPTNANEAALVVDLEAGLYAAQLEGKGSDSGAGLAEVYDFDLFSSSRLTALSTRVFTGPGADVLVGGFIIDGSEPKKVVVRAIAPSFADQIEGTTLADPVLTLFRLNEDTGLFEALDGATNDNWETGISDEDRQYLEDNDFLPTDPAESALVITLDPGLYGGQITGAGGTSGIALIEVYDFED